MSQLPDRTVPPAVYPIGGLELPNVVREQLANGVQFVALDHGQQPVNRLTVSWPVGTADVESPEALGLLRGMLTEGTTRHTGAEIADIFEYNGAWIKIEAGKHLTSVTLHSLNSTAGAVIPLLEELLTKPAFDGETFVSIQRKAAASCELRRRKVSQRASELAGRMFYGAGHPLAYYSTPEAISAVSVDMVRDIHRKLMLSVTPTVYLAGCVDSGLRTMVKDFASQIDFAVDKEPVSQKIVPVVPFDGCREDTLMDDSSMQTSIKMVIPGVSREHSDYEMLRYTVFALGGYFGSRLMSNIRENKGYTYGISASLSSMPEGSIVGVSCEADNRYARAVVEETEREISRLATEKMDDSELEVVRSSIMSGLAAILDSPFSIMDYHQVIDQLGLPADYYSRQLIQLASLTPGVIMDCAARYLSGTPRVVAMAGNPV